MSYTPPAGDNVNFSFLGSYTPPAGDNVNFFFGIVAGITINSVSRTYISDKPGFGTTIVNWQSSDSGAYSFEIGGSGQGSGGIVETGSIIADHPINTTVNYTDVTTWSGFAGEITYRLNVYVLSSDDFWTPYDYTT